MSRSEPCLIGPRSRPATWRTVTPRPKRAVMFRYDAWWRELRRAHKNGEQALVIRHDMPFRATFIRSLRFRAKRIGFLLHSSLQTDGVYLWIEPAPPPLSHQDAIDLELDNNHVGRRGRAAAYGRTLILHEEG